MLILFRFSINSFPTKKPVYLFNFFLKNDLIMLIYAGQKKKELYFT